MNYKYKLYNDIFILTESEHKQVQENLAKGKNIVNLRGGKLIINMSHITSVTETDTLINETPSALKIESPKLNHERINQRLDEMKKVLWEKWGLHYDKQEVNK